MAASTGEVIYQNPIPVVVLLVPMRSVDGRAGLLTIRRAIEPFIGSFALPGGYIEYGDWRNWAAKELLDETGLMIKHPELVRPLDVQSTPDGTKLLIFAETETFDEGELETFRSNDEVSDYQVVFDPVELCFSLHTAAMNKFFESH
jgi:ADP-ribose pyrophosphatase YjhB (NUDIX family)